MGTRELVLLDYVGEGFVCRGHICTVLATEALRVQQIVFGGTAETSDSPAPTIYARRADVKSVAIFGA